MPLIYVSVVGDILAVLLFNTLNDNVVGDILTVLNTLNAIALWVIC